MRRAVYPGSFDPITLGHLDIVHRAANLFDELVVAVVRNPSKVGLFSLEERQEMIQKVLSDRPHVRVTSFEGLLVDFVESQGASVIVKGLRALSDFESEYQQSLVNRQLNPRLETVFLMTSGPHAFLSSSMVREIAKLGGPLNDMVPPLVEARLKEHFKP